MTLDDLQEREHAEILSVDNERLEQMGIRPSKVVKVLRRGACCLHIRVGSTEWAIRDRDARAVKIIPQ